MEHVLSERLDGSAPPWTAPVRVIAPGGVQSGTDLAATSRAYGNVRLYVTDASGSAAETWWGPTP